MTGKPIKLDNIQFEFLSMDCDYRDSYLKSYQNDYAAIFNETCVDIANGEKSQIRIAHPWTYFNITNHARFVNIEFTGEDLFAKAYQ